MDLSFRTTTIDSYEALWGAVQALLKCHPYFDPLTWHGEEAELGPVLWDAWYELEADFKYTKERYAFSEMEDIGLAAIEHLVGYNNNRWNFAPNGAPPRIHGRTAVMLARCLLWRDGLLRVEVEPNVADPRLAILDRGAKWFLVEEWSWPDKEYYLHETKRVAQHLKEGPALKSYAKLLKGWEPVEEEYSE